MSKQIIVRLGSLLLLLALFQHAAIAQQVEQWGRHIISIQNVSYSGNPFEIEVDGIFTHTSSGTSLTIPGYYAGNSVWKIAFMPTKTGAWTYRTVSPDSDLNGETGSISATATGQRGFLAPDPANPRKWKFSNGDYVIPISLRMNFFYESGSSSDWNSAVDFLANDVDGLMYDTRLQLFVFDGSWSNHQFDLDVWDRMEERMNALAARGRGAYIMFYADGSGKPLWNGQSNTEALLIRYAVARLGAYPIVMWDTGIDISEYRDGNDIDWFGAELGSVDPYNHPRSSRSGGGSGSYLMANRTYESRGDRIAEISEMLDYFDSASRPTDMSDSWGENRPSHPEKNFSPEDLRRAFWKALIAGGLGGHIRGSDGAFTISGVKSDLESESWLKLVNKFLREKLGGTFGGMVPASSLVSNGYALADASRTKIVFFLMGNNDRWDSGNGGTITIELSSVSGNFSANWYDTRSGQETSAGNLAGGTSHTLNPPSSDDWILLLVKEGTPPGDFTAPAAPGNLTAD